MSQHKKNMVGTFLGKTVLWRVLLKVPLISTYNRERED